jgi:tripartite-type tricarboxylate transporter receptor subunit TctC
MKLPHRRQFLHQAAGAVVLPTMSRTARAQAYPSRPMTIVAPFAAGGGGDTVARILAERMRESLGQPVIVENVTGANGAIATARVARAAPDGYTLVLGNISTHVFNGALYANQFDVLNDFTPISLLTTQPYLIAARKDFPANDLRAFVSWLKANPDKATAGTAGVGNISHLAGLFFQNATGTRFQFVPYRGGALALQDLVGGHIDLIFTPPADSSEQVRAGTIKTYAVMAKDRMTTAADIPTVDEAGLPELHLSGWQALFAPKGIPTAALARLNAAVVDALAAPVVRRRLTDLRQEIPPPARQTPEALGALQQSDIEKWWPIIKSANIKGE